MTPITRTGAGTPSYVLVTAARNEAEFIELTMRSVVAQTLRPVRWVIVSDGSTDGTDDIVRRYAQDHPWIQLVQMPPRHERHFAARIMQRHAANSNAIRAASIAPITVSRVTCPAVSSRMRASNLPRLTSPTFSP